MDEYIIIWINYFITASFGLSYHNQDHTLMNSIYITITLAFPCICKFLKHIVVIIYQKYRQHREHKFHCSKCSEVFLHVF